MLPAGTSLGAVTLSVANIARSLEFYVDTLGFTLIDKNALQATIGGADNVPLVHLHEVPDAEPRPVQGSPGVYHFAVLLPSRVALGTFVEVLAKYNIPVGASDHLVSEAFYISDPDGIGIEIYADRPRSEWRETNGQLDMATLPIDIPSLRAAADGREWAGVPAGTTIGHLHFHASDLPASEHFYEHVLGFDSILKQGNALHFFSTGGYHHHIGANTWARGAYSEHVAALTEWELLLPDEQSKTPIRERAGVSGDEIVGPDGVVVKLRVRRAAGSSRPQVD